ncbi:zinc finger protein 385A isoform X5 [Chrysemys picta bellii]|uniref:zinc finger protein 385A isoform X5 n=1 Tax=Chrysemys picta bellii TaxID=8478 RepID=UPI001C676D50|nr:zinc finger protein 385A isoform X4 [Chrysemys picta bellii]
MDSGQSPRYFPGSLSRAAPLPAMLRAPPAMIQPPLDIKHFLPFPMEAQPAVGLFPGFSTVRPWLPPCPALQARMDPVQKAVINHTFGAPLSKARRPVISCNVCQIRFNSESQAEAHYKGNRHARRVKGMEAAKTRQKESGPREGDKPGPVGSPMSSVSESDSDKPAEQQNGLGVTVPSAPASPFKPPYLASPVPAVPPYQASFAEASQEPRGTLAMGDVASAPAGTSVPSSNGSAGPGAASKSDEEKAKKLLYCALCKVAVNSLSQLEAHNKGTKHKTILEARSGLGPIKAYPRLGPTASGEPGSQDPNAQERTFHCEICNVKVNSEIQLKQGPLAFPKDLPKSLAAGLLPSPLAMAAAMAAAASAPLTLRPTPPLLQGPPLTHPLLRPAPGPIRTAHGPILFSPY